MKTPSDAAAVPDAPIAADAGPVLRTIELRNPFGNTSLVDNLLVDGDFELTSGSGQYGWRSFSQRGEEVLARETGGLCRSGVTCGVLTSLSDLIGFGAAPRGAEIEVGVWAKPPEPDCNVVGVSVISCSSLTLRALATALPSTDSPDPSGWCHYQGVAPAMEEQPCLYVIAAVDSSERVLVDDAYLTAAPATAMRRLAATAPPALLLQRMEHALKWIHEHKKFGRADSRPPRLEGSRL